MRAEEQKQECKLEWPYCEEGGRTEASTIQPPDQKQTKYNVCAYTDARPVRDVL